MEALTSVQWINSVHLAKSVNNTVFVKEKEVTIDKGTSEILDVKDKLKFINNPKRVIYITKPQYRTYKYKKDTEDLSHVDKYIIEDQYKEDEIRKLLELPKFPRKSLLDLCDSPYVYNADISIEALIRAKYQSMQKHNVIPFRIGGLDIETSVLDDDTYGCINCISFCTEHNTYTAVLERFLYDTDASGKRVKKSKEDIVSLIHEKIQPYLDEYNFNPIVVVCKNEVQLLKWIFDRIHDEKVDFIYIWNINFDIPKIIERIQHYNYDESEFFCHPDVPKDYRFCKFKEDKRMVQHIVDKWHWFYCTDYTQYIDGMLLYARIRKADSKEPSYSLDAISTKVLGVGKLKFSEGSHYEMQMNRFTEYTVYNLVDAMLLVMMGLKTNDISQLYGLTGTSPYPDFSKQTVMLRNIYYKFCLDRDKVFSSVGKLLVKQGGAVLKASLVKDIGLHAVVELPEFESYVVCLGADLDFKAYYPSTQSMYGLAKENKLCTVVQIEGKDKSDIEAFMGAIASPEVNSVWLGSEYFGLPNYREWDDIYMSHLTDKVRSKYS